MHDFDGRRAVEVSQPRNCIFFVPRVHGGNHGPPFRALIMELALLRRDYFEQDSLHAQEARFLANMQKKPLQQNIEHFG